ncbi:MAG TPA: malto-oligosyltrehalose trehalohydrolase [Candidatus Acidoferrales bacterium]|nr:malto-oligosyltrehalose trehalohydrolase [Candidatus Acidoferrales bacterium]
MQDILGAHFFDSHCCSFCVWAPRASTVELRILGPEERVVPVLPLDDGYFQTEIHNITAATNYFYRLDENKERPDPASRFQPEGVHGPSQIVDPSFRWDDAGWAGIPLKDYVIYELHVGVFTREGSFEAIIPHLSDLKALGVTAIELMPVAQFPGARNWGYDGVFPFAVQNSYGGPRGLKQLVNACHKAGLAVILDVVYNHVGPEGNYLADFAPYFTDRYNTPWGPALNFDGPDSDHVRRFFIENALYWFDDFHFDALRLDAVHAIFDHSPFTFLEQLREAVAKQSEMLHRRLLLFPESAANDARLVRPPELCGLGFDAQWNDDFHHALRTVLTNEKVGYYEDYGAFNQLVKAYREGFVYSGEYSRFRRRRHGTSSRGIGAERFIVFSQNHDQIGNRREGDRLVATVSFEDIKLAAGAVLLSPFVPLLFMGEEYGEPAPFAYFTSHGDADLVEAVRRGRRAEFAAFGWHGALPDPQDEATFWRAKLNHNLKKEGSHRTLLEFYRELLRLRRRLPALALLSKEQCEVFGLQQQRVMALRRWNNDDQACVVFNYGSAAASIDLPLPQGKWRKALDSADPRWGGPRSALPSEFNSNGSLTVSLNSRSFILLTTDTKKV